MNNKELIKSLVSTLDLEIERLESRIKELENEVTQYKKILGMQGNVAEFENLSLGYRELKIKPQYIYLSQKHHTIFESWIEEKGELNEAMLLAAGYKFFTAQQVDKAGTSKAWTHKSILEGSLIYQQSPDHFHTVIQIAAYLIKMGFTNVTSYHWSNVDVSAEFKGKTYAFEYERPRTHCIAQLKTKFLAAKQHYDTVYFVCSSLNKKEIALALEPTGKIINGNTYNMCTRGSQFKNFIERIISGNPVKNYPIPDSS